MNPASSIPSDVAIGTLQAVCAAFEPTLPTHHEATAMIAELLARRLGVEGEDLAVIKTAAVLHDIGKVAVSRETLLKEIPLEGKDWFEIENHPRVGAEIVAALGTPFFLRVAELVLHHHEKWNGSGYPHKLKGEKIPFGARILSVADVYHSLTSRRVYKQGWSAGDALAEVRKLRGECLDATIVDQFLALHRQMELPG